MKKYQKISLIIFCLCIISLSIYAYVYSHENVHLGKYRGLTTTKVVYNIKDGDINTSLKELGNKYPNQKKITTGTIKDKSKINVSYAYEINNKIYKNDSMDVTAGENSIGFEKKLIGMIVGEKTKVIVKYASDETNKELRNKTITYEVKINYIIKETTPTINDVFIKKHTKYNTVEEYKNYLKSEFIKSYEKNAETTAGNKLIKKIIKTSRVRNYPKKDVEKYKKNIRASYEDAAKQMDISFERLLKYMDMNEKEFDRNLTNEANFYVSKSLIVDAIAKRNFIRLSDKEYKK